MLTMAFIMAAAGSLVAIIAQAKGYKPGIWLLYGAILPPVAFVHILRHASRRGEARRRALPPPLLGRPV